MINYKRLTIWEKLFNTIKGEENIEVNSFENKVYKFKTAIAL